MLLPAPEEILRARVCINDAIRFLRGGRESELHLIEPSLSFEMGALHALDWVLGVSGGEWFVRHLHALSKIQANLIKGDTDDVHASTQSTAIDAHQDIEKGMDDGN
jgi:hypothetical protein